jgi:hypothetical protein
VVHVSADDLEPSKCPSSRSPHQSGPGA